MFNLRKKHLIRSIKFSDPLPTNFNIFTQFREQLVKNMADGQFYQLNADVILEFPDDLHRNCVKLTLNFKQPSADVELLSMTRGFLELFSLHDCENFYMIFHLNDDLEVDELATNLEPVLFRQLMCRAPIMHHLIAPSLGESDYWLPNLKSIVNKVFDLQLMMLKRLFPQLNEKLTKALFADELPFHPLELKKVPIDELFAALRPYFQIRSNRAKEKLKEWNEMLSAWKQASSAPSILNTLQEATYEYIKTPVKEQEEKNKVLPDGRPYFKAIQRGAFKRARDAQGNKLRQANYEDYVGGIGEFAKEHVRQQIVEQLTTSQIVNIDDSEEKLVLFVGAGDARNVREICSKFPTMNYFALEPLLHEANAARDRFQLPPSRQLIMHLEDLPDEFQFDLVFVFNYNVTSSQQAFFNKLFSILKPGGRAVVGRNVMDPQHIYCNLTISQLMRAASGSDNIEYPGWEEPAKKPNYRYKQAFYVMSKPSDFTEQSTQAPLTETEEYINELNTSVSRIVAENLNETEKLVQRINQKSLEHLSRVSNDRVAVATTSEASPLGLG